MVYISLEGNIGAGKSTLLERIRKDIVLVPEPVEDWMKIRGSDGKSILQLFYEDSKRYAYTFQHATLLTRTANLRRACDSAHLSSIVLSERCVDTDHHVFASLLHRDGVISDVEWQLYGMSYDALTNFDDIPDGLVYLNTPPEVCLERIRHRARTGEDNITLDYLKKLHVQHENWIGTSDLPVLTLTTEEAGTEAGRQKILAFAKSITPTQS